MLEEHSTDLHLDSTSIELSFEKFKGRIIYDQDNLPIIIDSNLLQNINESDLELIKSRKDVDLSFNDRQNLNKAVPPYVHIYNNHIPDKSPSSGNFSSYRVFTLRNVNNLEEISYQKLFSLQKFLTSKPIVTDLATLSEDLCAIELETDFDETIKQSSNNFWSEINIDCAKPQCLVNFDTKPVLMCFICKLTFNNREILANHADTEHNTQLNVAEKYLLLKLRPMSAIIQYSNSSDKKPLLSFFSEFSSIKEQQSDNIQKNTNNFLNSLLGEAKLIESQPKIGDLKEEIEPSPFGDLADLANLESIAKAAAAALQKQEALLTSHSPPPKSANNSPQPPKTPTTPNANLSSINSSFLNSLNSCSNTQSSTVSNSLINCLTSNNKSQASAVANLVSLLPQLTVQQQQQLQLLASVNNANALLSNNSSLLNNSQPMLKLSNLGSLSSSQSSSSQLVATSQSQQTNSCQSQQTASSSSPNSAAVAAVAAAAGLGQHHMAMLHSRNSCKTLKCPKCNWHYKYQETLEIHMKEKHPETELNCVYCLANQPHPRLARGETYTCGYKPYRCDVCNYSTTTKGNLSIHMQSDKHINNVQELQSGNLPPEMLQNLVQQQPNSQPSSSSSSISQQVNANNEQVTTSNSLLSPTNGATSVNPSLSKASSNSNCNSSSSNLNNSSNNSQLNSVNNQTLTSQLNSVSNLSSSSNLQSNASSNGKAIWRCDVCNYETSVARNLRIHMTSEKHTHNIQLLKQNINQMQQLNALQGSSSENSATAMLQQLNPQFLAALAAANSNTNNNLSNGSLTNNNGTASNNSHTNGDSLNSEQIADLTYNQALLLMAGSQSTQSQNNNSANLNKQNINSSLLSLSSSSQPIIDLEHPDPSLRFDHVDYDEHHCRLFQCMVCSVYTCDSIDQLATHLQIDRTKLREDEVLVALSGNFICKLCSYKTNLKANFQLHCKTDKHLQRLQQVNHIKEGGNSNEWKLKYVNVSNPVQLRCNLCDYYTNSLHKLQLHVTNSRHEASTRVFLHLQIGDQVLRATDLDLKQTFYRCEPCSLSHSTIFELLHHLNSLRHLQSENLRQLKLQMALSQGSITPKTLDEEIRELFTVQPDNLEREELDNDNQNQTDLQLKSTTSSSNINHMLCPLCQSQFTLRANLQQHIIDVHNVSKEGVQRLMAIVDIASEPAESVKENHNIQSGTNVTRSDSPISPSNKSNQQQLNNSLNSNHSGNGSVLDDLDAMEYDESTEPLKVNNSDRHSHKFRCNQCPLSFRTPDKLQIHSQYHKIRAASQCALCGKTTRSIESMQKHMEVCHKEMNEQDLDTYRLSLVNNPLLLSIKNGCQGVLDPNTTELLKRESNRDCESSQSTSVRKIINGRQDDSLDDEPDDEEFEEDNLQLEQNDSQILNDNINNDSSVEEDEDMNKEECSSLENSSINQNLNNHNNSLNEDQLNDSSNILINNLSVQNNLNNEEYLNSQNVAEDSYNDPTRKFRCHRCCVAYTRQSYLSAHNKTLYHRKGEKLTYPMEKYLDPNRPFKCEMCKESFTQKNILMTHYNSVSHLHKLNQAMKESNLNSSNDSQSNLNNQKINNIESSNNEEDKPYKCNICKISFSNGSALDVHIQSVLHQSRASKLPQLAINGQIDLCQPLVERPTEENSQMQSSSNVNLICEQIQLLQQQLNAANNQQQTNNNHLNLTCSRCSMVFSNQDSLTQHLQICTLLNAVTGKTSLNNSSHLNSLELLQKQQLLQPNTKYYNAPVCKTKPPVYKHLLETWGFEIVMQFNEHHQRRKKLKQQEIDEDKMIVDENNLKEINTLNNGDIVNELKEEKNSFIKNTKELENFKNREAAIKLILEEEEDQEEKKENDPNTSNNIHEINKSRCDTCLKEFSSIWVLKAHKEEVHKDVVKMQTVQDFAEIYRKEFERKNNIVVKSVVLENENNSGLSANQLSSNSENNNILNRQRSQTTQSEHDSVSNNDQVIDSSNENKNNDSNTRTLQPSSNLNRSDQNDLNSSTNSNNNSSLNNLSSISTNNNGNSSVNSDSNNLLGNNPNLKSNLNPLLAANPLLTANPLLANNPVLNQAMASMMQQQNSQSSGNNMNEMANQMAQLQMSQLLMSIGLAGAMGVGTNSNQQQNQQQQQQAAAAATAMALGLPAQMLPLLMANASNDPMMNLFNPMMAAVAANSQNPLSNANVAASLLSGMTPEAMVAAGFVPNLTNNSLGNLANTSICKSPNTSMNTTSSITPGLSQAGTPTTPLPSTASANLLTTSQSLAQQQAAAQNAQSGKRARTRISDDQLKILRQYFDINNSPTEEALQEMAAKSQLPLKVIKHWFRNTLFKERQRNKDSPYNFNNPPSTFLNLEEYEKTGETKVLSIDGSKDSQGKDENSLSTSNTPIPSTNSGKNTPAPALDLIGAIKSEVESKSDTASSSGKDNDRKSISENKSEYDFNSSDDDKSIKAENTSNQDLTQQQNNATANLQQFLAAMAVQQQQVAQQQLLQSQLNGLTNSLAGETNHESVKSYTINSPNSEDSMDSLATNDTGNHSNMQIYSGLQFANLPGMPPLPNSLQLALQNSQLANSSSSNPAATLGLLSGQSSATSTPNPNTSSSNSANNPGKRANRTRFTDYQIRVLQEFFEGNAYPKDDDLEYLSKMLNLSPRVIVVWFQNARQKARKVYENQPASINDVLPGTPTMPPASTTPTGPGVNLTPCTTPNSANSSNSATPNPLGASSNSSNSNAQKLNYHCKKCMQTFQRYYELIKHQKSSCFKDENPLAIQIKAAQEAKLAEEGSNLNNSLNNSLTSSSNLNANSQNNQASIQNGTFQCDKCSMSFNRLDLFREHSMVHLMNPNLFSSLQGNNGNSANGPFGNMLGQFEAAVAAAAQQQQQNQPSASPSLSGKSPSTTPLPLFNNDLSSNSPTHQQQSLLLQQQLLQQLQFQQQSQNQMNIKRKYSNEDEDDCDSQSGGDGSQCSGNGSRSAANSRDKRLRTTILPEQLDYLYQKYQLESNPSRKMLESISEEVGLKKRVVQVWFQNTRARERKGQLRAHQQVIHKRCPFCRALFKARSALESHLATRHADQYTKGEIDIDALPDSDSADEQSMSGSTNALSNALNSLGLASSLANLDANGDGSSNGNLNNALNTLLAGNLAAASGLLGASGGSDPNSFMSDNLNNGSTDVANQFRQLFSNLPNLRKYMNEMSNGNDNQDDDLQEENESLNNAINNNNNEAATTKKKGEFALDLSKPLDLS